VDDFDRKEERRGRFDRKNNFKKVKKANKATTKQQQKIKKVLVDDWNIYEHAMER
jgi:hypothetical protein